MIKRLIRPLVRAFVRLRPFHRVDALLDAMQTRLVPLMAWCRVQQAYMESYEEGLRREDLINLRSAFQAMEDSGRYCYTICTPMMSGNYFGPIRPWHPYEVVVYEQLVKLRKGPSKWVL